MNNISQLRNDCMFLKTYNRNNLIYSKLNICPGSQKLMGHVLQKIKRFSFGNKCRLMHKYDIFNRKLLV